MNKPGGPCEAEEVWFAITDRFYKTLNNQGPRAAAALAAKAFDAMAPIAGGLDQRNHRPGDGGELGDSSSAPPSFGHQGEHMNYAVKALGGGRIEAYALRFGSPQEPDRSRERDFFTPQTDLMLQEWGWPRPILLEHMATPEAESAGSVGQWHGATKDAIGVKLHGQLNTAHPLYPRLASDIGLGKYFLSSDSAPHLVKRRAHLNGTNELTRWGLLTASLTKSPAEHRLMPATMVKRLALKAGARHSAADMAHIQGAHDAMVKAGAVCAPAGKAIAKMTPAEQERAMDILDELDDLMRQVRIEAELDQIERG